MICVINNDDEQYFIKKMLTESFFPKSACVIKVKEYLDSNFKKNYADDIGSNGYPIKVKSVTMISSNNQPLKSMSMKELLSLLDGKFQTLIHDKSDRKKFLKQIIIDWFDGKITKEGVLSVNRIK